MCFLLFKAAKIGNDLRFTNLDQRFENYFNKFSFAEIKILWDSHFLNAQKKTEAITQINDTIETIIEAIDNKPYGVSENNVLYAGLNELGGYHFFQTVIVGAIKVKVKNGAKLLFLGDNFELRLDSDSMEFESDFTDIKGRHITKIDFQIEEFDIKKLQDNKLTHILLSVKNHEIKFGKYEAFDEEE
ncbi:hypothetical protein [uncultured Winogradskyella sp.]|uniref:hypothetical protein n=1 Tax=uncultured Winogradskyella sp. TaxID=395353 RepID=UPI0026152E8F|nr:hypothetical protein [uncultured Winogradskyella sp.]